MIFFLLLFVFNVSAQYGPGRGPWQTGRPEDYGLSTSDLDAAESATNSGVSGRTCYLVIKNGVVVYERYRGTGSVTTRRAAYSCTKSMCGSLYGIAVQQGWASVTDKVSDRNRGTRNCNNNALFQHVLTMTGQSSNINNPRFSYDTTGTGCLDCISDFIAENNPDGISTNDWKNKFWHDIIGLESMTWSGSNLGCGFGATTSCRDLARAAQLYLNDGAWPGVGQVMNEQYTKDSRKQMLTNIGENYGYTVWRQANDPVDPDVSSFNGMYSQCAYMTKDHEAIIVSMGQGDITGALCSRAWTNSRNAIISKNVRHLYNITLSAEERAKEDAFVRSSGVPHEEILAMGKIMQANSNDFPEEDIRAYEEYLAQYWNKLKHSSY